MCVTKTFEKTREQAKSLKPLPGVDFNLFEYRREREGGGGRERGQRSVDLRDPERPLDGREGTAIQRGSYVPRR